MRLKGNKLLFNGKWNDSLIWSAEHLLG